MSDEDYRVCASKDSRGKSCIRIQFVEAIGYDNVVAELSLNDDQIDPFVADVLSARNRANAMDPGTREPSLRPYGP